MLTVPFICYNKNRIIRRLRRPLAQLVWWASRVQELSFHYSQNPIWYLQNPPLKTSIQIISSSTPYHLFYRVNASISTSTGAQAHASTQALNKKEHCFLSWPLAGLCPLTLATCAPSLLFQIQLGAGPSGWQHFAQISKSNKEAKW